jgi:F420-non-reducing hydrogenase iron-sulfur subunit
MCTGRIDPTFVVKAFAAGADGVVIGGCHPGDCHYNEGNYKTMRRVALLKKLLTQFGVEPERFRLEWVSAGEGSKWVKIANEMTEQLKALGPRVRPESAKEAVA